MCGIAESALAGLGGNGISGLSPVVLGPTLDLPWTYLCICTKPKRCVVLDSGRAVHAVSAPVGAPWRWGTPVGPKLGLICETRIRFNFCTNLQSI